jgi:hypothetical protein
MAKCQPSQKEETPAVSRGRHEYNCSVCSHIHREEIERDFVNWVSPARIAKHYKLANRASVYRHAHAFGLFPKRQRNVRAGWKRSSKRPAKLTSQLRRSSRQFKRIQRSTLPVNG